MYQYLTILMMETIDISKINIEKILNQFAFDAILFLKGLLIAIVVIILGKKIIRFVTHLLMKFFERSKIEISVSGFLIAFMRAIMYTILLITAVQYIGIKSSSIVALVGSAGLTLGLALQGSLSNFAGGVLILILKPFRVGDYIISGVNEGTVTAIDIFYTKLLTFDNRLLVMPNGALSNANIINASNETNRRLDLNVSVDYSENIQKVKDLLMIIAQNNEAILKDQEISIFVNSFDPSAINIGIRVWVMNENYWTLKCKLLEQIKNDFDENQITIPLNQLDVNIRNSQLSIKSSAIKNTEKTSN